MTEALTITQTPSAALIPMDADKDVRYRLKKFTSWLGGRSWLNPDLAGYRDFLLSENYAASTVSAHLSTVRARYATILRDNVTRDLLYSVVARTTDSTIEKKAFVDETITRLKNAADPENSKVKTKTIQDRPDSDHLRLSREEAEALMAAPGTDTLRGLRDTAIISLLLTTGIREHELCQLEVADLRQRLGGELALHIREGKGAKERLIPFGVLSWALLLVDAWLAAADIEDGPVFRGFWKGGALRPPGPLSVRAVQYIVGAYPIVIDGESVKVKPHDLRRTYGRRFYMAGGDPIALQQNYGHADLKTTLGYIGELNAERRRPPAIYSMPTLGQLKF